MSRVIDGPDDFTVIGENIHATRVVLRNGRRAVTLDDGTEAVTWKDGNGEERLMIVPEHFKESQAYGMNQHKHFMIAIWKGVHGDAEEAADGTAYVQREAVRQAEAGAKFLDLNVDEVSPHVDEQKRSMRWVVEAVQEVATVPVSVDSSLPAIIEEGLAAYDGSAGRPMMNSVALERIDSLELVTEHNAHVVVTAAGRSGMPDNADERVENVSEVLEAALSAGIPPGDLHVDGLVFPIAVDGRYGMDFLNAISQIREKFGNEVHVGGGLSNVSFGIPNRRLVNDVFLRMAIERGADSGIIDPITTKVARSMEMDMDSERVQLALDMLHGNDEFCMNYITAHREGRLRRN